MNNVYIEMSIIIFIMKIFLLGVCTYYTSLKISSDKKFKKNLIISIIIIGILSIISGYIKTIFNYPMSIIFLIMALSVLYALNIKSNASYSIITTTISLGVNYIIFFLSILISFIPNVIFNIQNDYINLLMLSIIHVIILMVIFKIKRLKNGLLFIKNKINNEYFDIIILNVSVIVVLVMSISNNLYYINKKIVYNLFQGMIIFSIIMFITIQKTLTMYYKHKMLVKHLDETKEELERTKKDRDKLEQENLNLSKVSHSISHRQKSLQRKLDKLMMNSEITNELDIKDRLDKISNEYSKDKAVIELSKTGIEVVDDMLECMRDECIENNINFELQLSGNIHYMTNNFVSKEELEILLADHIKDAIIAIQHSDNINRSILVRIGVIDEFYSLYIYDSGIEFEIDTLVNLGTKAITTHEDEGGTGMGFLNTFDTLRKYKASMIIDEIGKTSKDNYTKVIMIKFDGKDEFRIKSYRSDEIKKSNINNNVELI